MFASSVSFNLSYIISIAFLSERSRFEPESSGTSLLPSDDSCMHIINNENCPSSIPISDKKDDSSVDGENFPLAPAEEILPCDLYLPREYFQDYQQQPTTMNSDSQMRMDGYSYSSSDNILDISSWYVFSELHDPLTFPRTLEEMFTKSEGFPAFTHGLGPALIRSPFANGATSLGFKLANRSLNLF
ncbi:hypothetical protein BT96DRAFT_998426 [Gymnopus androsaceus JB14]|uniref:Uncharacterized protein n=1 Tax=Gymnopus androsaceus JB14 TaxID=1447944 RepID=A0A6A4HBN5_9AGAR|nr:hypothetical protein BT96DRAFT_998426 [Gymnopus androsaceus JB14]